MPRPSRPAARGRALPTLTRLEDRTNPVSFGTPYEFIVGGAFPVAIAVGDVNSDGTPDLAAASNDGAFISTNDGNGNFTLNPTPVLAPAGLLRSVNLPDLNGDGHLDVVADTEFGETLAFALGNGDGTFGPLQERVVGQETQGAVVADFNRDGRPDVAVVTGGVRVFLNTGTAAVFGTPTLYAGGLDGVCITNGDFDGDGDQDLAIGGAASGFVYAFLNNGDGTFAAPVGYPVPNGYEVRVVAAGDLNRDGRDDLIVTYVGSANADFGVSLAGPGGIFAAPTVYTAKSGPSTYVRPTVVADVDLDGQPDVTTAVWNTSGTYVFLGNGTGVLAAPVQANDVDYPEALAVADVTGDGRPDLVNGVGTTGGSATVTPNTTAVRALTVVAIPSAVAGQGFDVTVTVRNTVGNPDPTYTGTVRFTSDDPRVSPGDGLPVDYTFVAGDSGTKTFTGVFLETAGIRTITATATGLPVPAISTVRVTPAAVARLTIDGPGATTAGVSQTYTVTAFDAFDNVATNFAGAVRVTSSDTRAVLPPNFNLTAGTGTFDIELQTAGTQSVTALLVANGAINATRSGIVVSPAAPVAVSAAGGNNQTALTNNDFAAPLTALVTDAFGNGVPGVTVTFTAPGSGPSATFPGGNTAVTDATGRASVAARANGTIGLYTVTASAPGITSATFNLGNSDRTPGGITVVSGGGQSAEVGTAFADPLVVRVLTSTGLPVEGALVRFTAPASGASAALSNGGLAVTDANGDASLTPTANTVAGAYAVTAAVSIEGGGTATVEFLLTNTPGAAVGFVLASGGDQSVAVGTPFEQPVAVKVVDQYGNGVPGVTVTLAVDTAANGATALLTGGAVLDTDSEGLARFILDSNTITGSYGVTATAAGLPGTVETTLTNLPGTPAAVQAVSGGGQTRSVNSSFPNPLRARVVDNFGNGVPGVAVTFRSVPAANGAGALFPDATVFPDVIEVTTDADGFATTPVRANIKAGAYTVRATTDGVLAPATYALTNTVGDPALIRVLAGDGAAAEVGTDFAPVRVRVEDAFGNGVAGVTVTFDAPDFTPGPVTDSAASATFAGGATAVTDANGEVAVTPAANRKAGAYVVTAAVAGVVTDGTATLTNRPAAPFALTDSSGTGQSARVNTAFAQRLGVTVRDRFTNPVPGVQVRFAGPLDPEAAGVAFLSGPATEITTDDEGRAEAAPGANTNAGSYDVTATVAGVAAAVTYQLTNTPGPAFAVVVVSGTDQAADVEAGYALPLVARVVDEFDNPIADVDVTFTAPAFTAGPGGTDSAASAVFPGGATTATVPTGADGTASVTATANRRSGPFAVTATAAGLGGQTVTFRLANRAGAAVGLAAVSGGGQTARVTAPYLDPLVVAATDRFGNPVPGVAVTVAAPATGASVTFPGGTAVTSGADGLARFPAAANTTAGPVRVTATAAAVPGASAAFDLTNEAGAPARVAKAGGDGSAAAGEAFAQPLAVLVTDEFDNPVSGAVVVFAAPTFGATAALAAPTATTGADGVARLAVTAGEQVGAYVVTAAVGGAGEVTFALANTPAAPATITIVGGNNQSAQTNTAYAQPLVVEVRDRFGNLVPGAEVVYVAPPAGGTRPGVAVAPASRTAGADGRASFTATANGVAGPTAATFSAGPGGPSATFDLTNVTPPTGLLGTNTTVIGPGPGVAGPVRVLNPDGSTKFTLDPFPGFAGGVRTGSGDFNADGTADVVSGSGPGAAVVVVNDGVTGRELFRVQPFGPDFAGGVFVAAGDLDGDGAAELVVTPDVSGGPRVIVYRGRDFAEVASFFGIDDPDFRGGARAAVGDINGDRKADLVVAAGAGGGPRVAAFEGASVVAGNAVKLFNDIFVFEQRLRDGVYVAVGDVDGDGLGDLVAGGGPGGGPRVLVLSGADLLSAKGPPRFVANFFAGPLEDRNGVRVATKDLDRDARADLVVGAANKVRAYYGATITSTGAPPEAFALDATFGVFVG